MDACQQRFLEALEGAANRFKAETQGEALHYIIGAIMREHSECLGVQTAIAAIKERERARFDAARGAR